MDQQADGNSFYGHNFYSQTIQEDENMQARLKAILNQIQENRVTVKELHIEYAMRFSDIIITYHNRLEENMQYYDNSIEHLIEKREKMLDMCKKLTGKEM